MKRGKPLSRRTALRARQALARRGRLNRVTALGGTAQKPAGRPKVTREERAARRLVRERSGGTCEICGWAPAVNWHHRRARSQSGEWSPVNGLALCGSGTTGCHGFATVNPAVAYERGWSVRSTNDPASVPVFLAGRGWSLLRPDGSVAPVERKAA